MTPIPSNPRVVVYVGPFDKHHDHIKGIASNVCSYLQVEVVFSPEAFEKSASGEPFVVVDYDTLLDKVDNVK